MFVFTLVNKFEFRSFSNQLYAQSNILFTNEFITGKHFLYNFYNYNFKKFTKLEYNKIYVIFLEFLHLIVISVFRRDNFKIICTVRV